MMFTGASIAKGPRENAPEEKKERTPAQKPVFKGKAKLGGAPNEEVANSRMNYDFSRMQLASASSTAAKKEGGAREGGDRQNRGPREARAAFDDDGFEVVKEKKKVTAPRRNAEEPSFGGGMPMFTRGGGAGKGNKD